MPDSDDAIERYRAQSDAMLAVAVKTPIPIGYADLCETMAVAHRILATARRNALPDVLD